MLGFRVKWGCRVNDVCVCWCFVFVCVFVVAFCHRVAVLFWVFMIGVLLVFVVGGRLFSSFLFIFVLVQTLLGFCNIVVVLVCRSFSWFPSFFILYFCLFCFFFFCQPAKLTALFFGRVPPSAPAPSTSCFSSSLWVMYMLYLFWRAQVPQFLMDQYCSDDSDESDEKPYNIVCTQPRRISAIGERARPVCAL